MRDFQEFINEKIIIVSDTKEEMESILKLCEKHGIIWKGTNKKPTDYNFKFGVSKLGIEHGLLAEGWLFERNREFVQASEFLQPQATIEIFQAKQTVVCLKKQDGKVIARGVARCNKDDVFNFDYGAELELNRMLENSKNKEFSKTIHEVGKKFAASFLAASAGISSVNSAIKAASEEQDNLLKESLFKSNHIQGDAVDGMLPKIKTLKDGTKIIKQNTYEVGDRVLLKKNVRDMFLESGVSIGKIVEIKRFYNDECCKNGVICNSGYPRGVSNNDIKGKVIE